jgi:hypothetical protein
VSGVFDFLVALRSLSNLGLSVRCVDRCEVTTLHERNDEIMFL